MIVQLLSGKTFDEDYNFTSTAANLLLPNKAFASAALGSLGEYNKEDGFTLGKTKTWGKAFLETSVNGLGNMGANRLGEYSLTLDKAMPNYQQFGFKFLSNTLGNSSTTAITEIK